jgi:hypothetical protein
MKKSILFLLALCLMIGSPVYGQTGLLRKVTKSVANDLLGVPDDSKSNQPEPGCASDQASLVFDLNGKFHVNYSELNISVSNDGRILVKPQGSDDNYIAKDGVVQGPYKSGDPELADFDAPKEDDTSIESLLEKNKAYISRSGEKFLITFNGKKYGPYAEIDDFIVTKSKNKFAAMVVENAAATGDQMRLIEAINNAKSEQEKIALGMKLAQDMSQNPPVDPMSNMPKLVTNITDASYDIMQSGGSLNGNINYDDILIVFDNKIINLQGKTLLTLKQEALGSDKELFINPTYTKYAYYKYGTLTFSDNTKLSELFGPQMVKEDGKTYISYMYYSPKKNSIMKWKVAL